MKANITITDKSEQAILELNSYLIGQGERKKSKEDMINWALQNLSKVVKHLDDDSLKNLIYN